MITYTIQEIGRIIKGAFVSRYSDNNIVKDLLIDSRSLNSPSSSLFFAIIGRRHDGHRFIGELYEKGVRNFVVSTVPENINEFNEANFLQVDNTLKALQKLATIHRNNFSIPVIGITGSNGKTIIKEWLFQLLSADKRIVRSPKSYNSQVGVPLSVWQTQEEHELAIFEAGISEPDEMDKLQPIIRPTIGIFTNIGHAHDQNFININQKVGEKLKLFTKVETLIYCSDYFDIQDRIIKSEILRNISFFTWSHIHKADLKILKTEKLSRQTVITATYKSNSISIAIPFIDDASIENAIHCWALMLYLGYHPQIIAERMLQLSPVAMRMELKEGINNCSVINDSYNSDINSLAIALDFLNQQKQHQKKTIILSDILQSSMDDDELYSEVAELITEKGISHVIGIGKAIGRQARKFNMEKEFYTSTEEFLDKYPLSAFHNETILLKGARVFEFEQISRVLQQKSHETVLEINLNALVNNLNYYRSKLNPGTKMMAMVKAFSYGSGSFEIANVLQFNHIDYLAVAYADEGVELRKAGITMPIMVMSPEEESLDSLIAYNLEPEVYNFRILRLLKEAIHNRTGVEEKTVPVHLKLDTGMHRLGFEQKELDGLIEAIKAEPRIRVRSVFSHLAGSDDSQFDEFTRQQIVHFSELGNLLREVFGKDILLHILNSSGIVRFGEFQFDMVRLGIGLYGVASNDQEQQKLQNVGTLKSIISQIKEIQAKESVGYNRRWVASGATTIGIVPVGYADGLDRRLGNGRGKLMIGGRFVPIIGDICMDMCMVDITGFNAKEGDEVIIFSEAYTVKQLAADLGTIPYEVLTSISRRVKRVYFYE
jgi:Alr-MurF fusion protein